MFVHPDFARRGLGGARMEKILRAADASGSV
jgi:GNAT superfamily N-acetyltransferase